jgi:hypothetical protein
MSRDRLKARFKLHAELVLSAVQGRVANDNWPSDAA